MPSNDLHPASKRTLWTLFLDDQALQLGAYLCKLARKGNTHLLATFEDHPLCDDWCDFAYKGLDQYFKHAEGLVYVITNPMHKNLYKVGQTKSAVETRIASLTTAGVMGYFVPVAVYPVQDRFAVEAAIHRALRSPMEARHHKEFFEGTWEYIVTIAQNEVKNEEQALRQFKS